MDLGIMRLGFALPVAGAWATPQNQVQVAQRAEALGYHSLWVLQRLLYAVRPKGDYPPLPGQPWPEPFGRVVDPVVTLAYVAGLTTTIRLGTAVLIMLYFTPILLAKQLATLDLVSGGRLDVGLGVGWSEDEYEAVGVPFRQRGRRANEFLRCLKAIWTEDPVEFAGEFYRVPRAHVAPRPLQQPHPPILVGGFGETVIDRVVRWGDGFLGGNVPLDRVQPLIQQIGEAAARAGRDPQTLRIVCRGTFRLQSSAQGTERRPLWGTLAEIREDVQRYAEAGVGELFLEANFDVGPDQMERAVDVMEALAPAP